LDWLPDFRLPADVADCCLAMVGVESVLLSSAATTLPLTTLGDSSLSLTLGAGVDSSLPLTLGEVDSSIISFLGIGVGVSVL